MNDFIATVKNNLGVVQKFIQTAQGGQTPTEQGVEEVKQAIADLDAVFNSDEVVEGLINIDPQDYAWYFGDLDNPGARQRALQITNVDE